MSGIISMVDQGIAAVIFTCQIKRIHLLTGAATRKLE
jgi:hypothetical protein